MQVHVLARRDSTLGEADDLVIALDRRTGGYRMRGDLVPGRNEAGHLHILVEQCRSGDELRSGDHHVIVGVQADGQ